MWEAAVYLLATLLLATLVHLVLSRRYKGRGPLYWWRWSRLVLEVWLERASKQPWANAYDISGNSGYEMCGIEATPFEKELERPKPLTTDRHGDGMMLCAVDREGRAVVARIVRLTQRRASVFLLVVDHTGAVYTLPNQPDTSQVNVSGEAWRGAGLAFTCVDPMRCWSLKFNGLLRRGAREEYTAGDADAGADDSVFHARLDLLWRAIHSPIDVWEEASPRTLAHALARHPNPSLDAFLCEVGEGYDQWGVLHGEVCLQPGSQAEIWYLRGPRQHRWGLNTAPDRALASFLYFNNGDMCSLHGHSSCTTQYMTGYVQGTGGLLKPITWTDLSLGKREDEPKNLGNNLLIKFLGGGRMYEVWQQMGPGTTFYSGDPWNQRHSCHRTLVASTHSYGWGITIFSDRYTGLCPLAERKSLPLVEVPRLALTEEEAPLVLTLDDPLCRNPDLTGGKGSSLALLVAYRRLLPSDQVPYEVPQGLVLTTAAWRQQLQSSSYLQQAVKAVRQAVRAVQQVDGAVQHAVGATHLNQLKEACSKAVEVCQRVPVCAVVTEALLTTLHQYLGPDDCRLAVRSSACGEDGEEACAAGQNQTVLGVRGHAHLLQALSLCWASNFSFRSVEYRRQHGQEVEVGVGVVVQEMVEATAAGVMFSLDPVTGSPDAITITANFGLGETVVSASVEPDTVVVRRFWTDRLAIASKTLGTKMTKCIMQEEGGTVEVEIAPEERGLQCLSDAMALRLAGLAVFLEKAFAGPRDLEFAVSQEKVYFLQARPITSLHAWTDYEIIHEQDTALITENEIITSSNTGEVLPGATRPLTLSTVLPALNLALSHSFRNYHSPRRRLYYNNIYCVICYSRVFVNVLEINNWTKGGMTLVNHSFDLLLHGCQVTTPQFVEWGLERMAEHSYTHWTFALAFQVYSMLTAPGDLRRSKSQFGQYHLDCDRADSAASLYSEISRRLPHLLQISKVHMNTSRLSSTSQTIAFHILANGQKEFSEENKTDIATMLASSGAESAEVPTALEALSQLLAESEDVQEFLVMTPDEGHVWLQSHPGDVGKAFREFLFKHGHRCIKEFDLGSFSWGLDPSSLVQTLQVMVRKPGVSSNKNHLTVQQALEVLRSPISDNSKRALRFLLPICREAVIYREASKSLLIKVVDGIRRAYRKLGELMVGECRLPSPDLIFYLKHSELGRLLDSPSPSLITKAVRRKRLHSHLEQMKFPRIIIGMPKPIVPGEEGGSRGGRPVEVLTGTPVCHGLVTAPVRVIKDFHETPTIQSGEVLVTFSTDVGWTPYFPLLAGVITEIGGLVSHGAVVAREYGLPCVVGVTAASHILNSGEIIELNAVRGTITRLHLQHAEDQPPSHASEDDEDHDSDGGCRESTGRSDSDYSLQDSEHPPDQA